MDIPASWRKKDGRVVYTEIEEKAFKQLRDALKQEPVLAHPNFDLPFETHCDGSKLGIGATISQRHEGVERVICYASRSLAPNEKAYSTWELEALAIVWSSRLWRLYLSGSKFKIVTDSNAAKAILEQNTTKAEGRILRWKLAMTEFDYEIVHRKGKRHGDADGLSRFPINSDDPYDMGPTDIEPPNVLSLVQYRHSDSEIQHLDMGLYKDENTWKYQQGSVPNHRTDPIYVPEPMRTKTLKTILSKFQHLSKGKAVRNARSLVWWPGITKQLRELFRPLEAN